MNFLPAYLSPATDLARMDGEFCSTISYVGVREVSEALAVLLPVYAVATFAVVVLALFAYDASLSIFYRLKPTAVAP